jgi:N-methylhydantoinase A
MSTRYAIGVDIGGTFTDCVVVDEAGTITTAKVPTTPDDRSAGFFGSIDRAADKLGVTSTALLADCDRIVHGTTTGTNAIVSREGAVVGLLTTAGHRDVMYLMKGGGRTSGLPADDLLHLPTTDKPDPLVPKSLIAEVNERVDLDGDVIVPLDEDHALEAIERLKEAGAEAVAVSFIWSVKNPDNERRVAELARKELPDTFVTSASDLVARVGEYERTTTAVMNAYIGPLMVRYVEAIRAGAASRGYRGRVLFAQCAGGAITVEEAQAAPIRTVQSGPVAGIVSSELLARRLGEPNVIAADMGGTTFDVSVIRSGVALERHVSNFQRYDLALPMLDVESIGAGGGSIAWIDGSGRLNVGPRSAGADPGPVCYGHGGTEPTTTDADVVLGIIDPDSFLHGRMPLDRDAAERAIARLAAPLGLSIEETAAGISRIVDSKMADLIRRMSVLRGFDPRLFVCFAFGGGGPVHASAVAAEAGIGRVIVPLPEVAPLWSALGAVASDVSHVYQDPREYVLPVSGAELTAGFDRLESLARETLEDEGFSPDAVELRRSVRMKYVMQVHDVEVPVKAGSIDDEGVARIDADFDTTYEQLYGRGAGYRQGGVQITGLQIRATSPTAKPTFPTRPRVDRSAVATTSRPVYWSETGGRIDTDVVTISDECVDDTFEGPTLLELPDTVIVVRPGQSARFDELGNVVIDIG